MAQVGVSRYEQWLVVQVGTARYQAWLVVWCGGYEPLPSMVDGLVYKVLVVYMHFVLRYSEVCHFFATMVDPHCVRDDFD